MIAVVLFLAAVSVFLAGALAGVLYEHCRRGGTADLQDRLRTVTRLGPARSRRAS